MTPAYIVALFERLSEQGRPSIGPDVTCAGFAGWLADAWDELEEGDLALLTAVGATLWREGFERRVRNAANDPSM
jgi:hypothetical protein